MTWLFWAKKTTDQETSSMTWLFWAKKTTDQIITARSHYYY